MKKWILIAGCLCACLASALQVTATETENLGLRIVPAPGKVTVDGQIDDWDLSGGIFACGDVENAATKYAVWFYAMYDKDNLYLLARWMDPTPMNNQGSSLGDYGFNGDCLQVRITTAPNVAADEVTSTDQHAKDAPLMRTSHMTCWRDREKRDVIDIERGRHFDEGKMPNAKTEGGAQAFVEFPDHKGYTQEISIPWKVLAKPGVELKAGDRILMTLEPNFTVGTGGRLTIKDLFKQGVAIDRVFTFQGNGSWGFATLEAQGKLTPRPVRLADGREFPVHLEQGLPVVDWTGLTKSQLPEGFKPIHISLPEDAYVSLNIFDSKGAVARQLLTSHFLTKGDHDIQWDGLTTPSVRQPGPPLPAGDYTWEGIYHTGIGLKLRGWGANSGPAPWQGWGADHGNPIACATAGDRVFLGWGGGEGDKPLLACDLSGKILWKNIRGGIASAGPVASDGKTVYAFNNVGQYAKRAVYRVDAQTGQYTEWTALKTTDLTMQDIWGDGKDIPEQPAGLAASGGKVFISFDTKNTVVVVDAVTGSVLKKLTVPKPFAIAAASAKQIFVVSEAKSIVSIDTESGETKTVVTPTLADKDWVSALAADKDGQLYVGIRGNHHHVLQYGPDGKLIRTIGRKEGRALIGPWTPDGMFNVSALAVDAQGKLWVAEDDNSPKRISVWDTQTGAFKMEFFGAASYGAIGAAVNPQDPNLLVGQGCEWRLDPKTGRSTCLGTITRDGMGGSVYGFSNKGKLLLAVTPDFLSTSGAIRIFERMGDAQYKLRAILRQIETDGPPPGKKLKTVQVWSDANDDGLEQPDEVKTYPIDLEGWFAGWYMSMTPEMTFYGTMYQAKVTGWTACGAPLYDLTQAKRLPGPEDAKFRGGMGAQRGRGSADDKYMLWNAGYGIDHGTLDCFEIATGKKVWSYPSNFTGVHGSHRAPGPMVGMIRGGYDIAGSAKLPAPIGVVWFVPTNKGEWHVLTEKGYYLTRLFEGDPTRMTYPEQAVPGASLDTCPPGAGEEAFGGSVTQGTDGEIHVQAGHISFWVADMTGLDTVKALPGGKVSLSAGDMQLAVARHDNYLKEASKVKRLVARKSTPSFTGALDKDFAGAEIAKYAKDEAAACRTALAWDDTNLYVGWEVKDSTPWVNGADAPEFLYARGDTVDLQISTDPKADKERKEAIAGDMRISIGPYKGKTTVVVYRKVAQEKHAKVFNSGVVKDYQMDSVLELPDAKVEVKIDAVNKRYVVEAALPLTALGLKPADKMIVGADFGATHGDKVRPRTVLRSHWSNQNTGLVSDEVIELQMTPSAWGELEFKN